MMKSEYAELFDDEKYRRAGDNVYDAGEFAELLFTGGELNLPQAKGGTVLYHAPCHLKSQGIGLPSVKLLRAAGFAVTVADADCCGMAGSFGLRQDKYDISMRIGERLFEIIKRAKADFLVSDCSSCRRQMYDGTGIAAMSPFELIGTLL